MEKKKSPTQLGLSLGSIAVYRDDLEEIISILTETCKQVIIEDNEYRFNSLDELFAKRGPYPSQLSINSREPFVIFNVRIKPRHTTLGTSGDGDNLAPYFRVKAILESRKRKGLDAVFMLGPFLSIAIIGLVWAPVTKRIASGFWFWLVFTILVTALLSLMVSQVFWGQGAYARIVLKRKHEDETFWTRNKDKIWLLIIGAIAGLIIGNIPRLFR